MKVKSLSRARLLATPWTTAYQAPPSMGFSRQEYWSGCHCLLRFTYIDYSKYITNRMKIVPPPESLLGSLSGPYEMLILEAKVTGLAWGMWFGKHD